MAVSQTIRAWFDARGGGSLYLPDGWYGRPFDNQHRLTALIERNDAVELTLDDLITLKFEGLSQVSTEGADLVFGPFRSLVFQARPYGGGAVATKTYAGGPVKLVRAPG